METLNLLCTNYNNIRKQYIYLKTIVRVSTESNIVMDISSYGYAQFI